MAKKGQMQGFTISLVVLVISLAVAGVIFINVFNSIPLTDLTRTDESQGSYNNVTNTLRNDTFGTFTNSTTIKQTQLNFTPITNTSPVVSYAGFELTRVIGSLTANLTFNISLTDGVVFFHTANINASSGLANASYTYLDTLQTATLDNPPVVSGSDSLEYNSTALTRVSGAPNSAGVYNISLTDGVVFFNLTGNTNGSLVLATYDERRTDATTTSTFNNIRSTGLNSFVLAAVVGIVLAAALIMGYVMAMR